MNHYLFCIRVTLRKPLAIIDGEESGKAVGYYRNVAVTASSEQEAAAIVSGCVDTAGASAEEIDWGASSFRAIDLCYFDREIVVHCRDPLSTGIWYISGRAFFPTEEAH